ncbi:MAG: hemolysin family protein [Verrucomicrobiia bacterium]
MMLQFSWQFFIVVLLIVISAFFVAAEFALVRIRISQIRPLLKTGDWRVRITLRVLKNLDQALSATQIGITLANLALGWIGEPFVRGWIEPLLGSLSISNPKLLHATSITISFIALPFILIVFGELVPKLIAIQRPKAVSFLIAGPLMLFYYPFKPFIWFLNFCANRVIRLLGFETVDNAEHNFSADELDYVLTQAYHTHPGDALINKIMIRSLRLRDTIASQVMLPKEQVTALWLDKSIKENLRIAQTSGHSRFPVCEGNLDNVKGMILIKEWLWQIQALGSDTPFQPLIRPVLTFTSKTTIPTLLELFRSSRSHLAVVLNENNGMAGILTIEDALEEIVGEIRDELDIEKGPIYNQTETSILVDANLNVRELRAETGWNFEWQPREKVGAWMVRHLGRLPKKGETARIGEFRVSAPEIHSQGPRRVRLERLSKEELEALETQELEQKE